MQLDTSHAAVETLLFRARRSWRSASPRSGRPCCTYPHVVRWLLGSGAGKATAVTAATVTLGTALTSDVSVSRVDAPYRADSPAGARYEAAPSPRPGEPSVVEQARPPSLRGALRSTSASRSASSVSPTADAAVTSGPESAEPLDSVPEPSSPTPATAAPEAEHAGTTVPPLPAPHEVASPVAGPPTAIEPLVPPVVTEVVTETAPRFSVKFPEWCRRSSSRCRHCPACPRAFRRRFRPLRHSR